MKPVKCVFETLQCGGIKYKFEAWQLAKFISPETLPVQRMNFVCTVHRRRYNLRYR